MRNNVGFWILVGIFRGGLGLLLLVWVVIRYRQAANPIPSKTSHNTIIEVVWTLAPVLILVADVVGRVIAPPAEVQVGVMTALIGVPVFIALIRTRRQVGL